MGLQVIKDGYGKNTGIFIPILDWDMITKKHEDLRQLVNIDNTSSKKLSDLAGTLSHETAEAMLKSVEESRDEWEERIKKQF